MDAKKIGALVRKRREALKWNAEDLAYYARLSRPTIDNVESGSHMPGIVTLEKISRALNVPVGELLGLP